MRQYYYSVSVLPSLLFDETPFFTVDEFLEHCAAFVSPEDMALIRSATIRISDTSEFENVASDSDGVVHRWNAFLRDVQILLARQRTSLLGWDDAILFEPSGADPTLADFARQLAGDDNPRRAELSLLRKMWNFLNELELGHFFDRDKLVVYYLRLQISFRREALSDFEGGTLEFDRQYEEVNQATMEIV